MTEEQFRVFVKRLDAISSGIGLLILAIGVLTIAVTLK